jgi:hypothetical protein
MQGFKTSLLLAGLLAASTSFAQKAEADAIEAQAKADKAACEPMKGNAKDVCVAEAKAKEKVAKAELRFKTSSSERDRIALATAKAEAEYDVAKEKCEDQANLEQQRACKAQAKATEKAQRDAAKPAKGGG